MQINLINEQLKIYRTRLGIMNNSTLIYKNLIFPPLAKLNTGPSYKRDSYNFDIIGNEDFTDNLYSTFLKASIALFGELTLLSDNKRKCWAQISNRHDIFQDRKIHNHINTSIINSVYYFSVPDANSGRLCFCDNNGNDIWSIQPAEGDLIIFPNYMNHYPERCNSEVYRIAINMEIICKENVWNS